MSFNNTPSLIFLSAIFAFSSCKKSDSGPGAPPAPPVQVMAITSISPTSGPSATLDTITGKLFTGVDSVYFNGKSAHIVSVSDTQLVVKVPPQAGTGKISVTAGGKSASGPVFTFTGNTYLVSTFAGSGNLGSINGTGTAASFNSPTSITIDSHDNLYVSDLWGNQIRKITPDAVVTTFAGSGDEGAANGTSSEASFLFPYGITADGNDNLYVADFFNNAIRKITPEGVVSTLAGSGSIGSLDAIGTAASFNGPQSIAVDSSGNVFVGDTHNFKIRKITPAGVVSTFAGSGVEGFADGNSTTAILDGVYGVNFDRAGNLYVADGINNVIRKITSNGTVSTIAGSVGLGGLADGTGTSATFNFPTSVVVDNNGFIYVTDAGNYTIRQISPSGQVTLIAGTPGSSEANDGPALQASFINPSGMAIDRHGNIFVVDGGNNTIRKLTPQ